MYKKRNFAQNDYRGEIMKNRKLKKTVVYFLYALSFVTIIGTIYFLDMPISNELKDDMIYVNDIILEDVLPVVSVRDMITKPFSDDTVSVIKNYYDFSSEEETQKNALIYYQGTYIPNTGIDYQGKGIFDVNTVLDGVVTKISENNLLGKIVEITHDNNLITIYQSLGDVNVVEGDNVIQGQIIGVTGTANISPDLGNHLHFEIIYNGNNINPEICYGKDVKDL